MKKDKTATKAVTDADVNEKTGDVKQVDVTVTEEGTGHDAINDALPKKTVKQNVSVEDAQTQATRIEENSTQSDNFEYDNVPLGREIWKLIGNKSNFSFVEKEDVFIIQRK